MHTVVFNDEGEDDEERGQTVELIEALEYEELSEQDHEEEEGVTENDKFDDGADTSNKGNQVRKVY